MVKSWLPVILLLATLFSGCASSSSQKGNALVSQQPVIYRFIGQGIYCHVGKGDEQIQFSPARIILTNTHLLLAPSNPNAPEDNEIRIPLRDLKGAALFPGDITHFNQLQLIHGRSLLAIHATGGLPQTSQDERTARLHQLLIAEGVPSWESELFYYAGMDPSKARDAAGSKSGFMSAAGATTGKYIWRAIKDTFKLLISPFTPF